MTAKQRSFIGHLYDTREAPATDPITGETPGIVNYNLARAILLKGYGATPKQASAIIETLLALPEKARA